MKKLSAAIILVAFSALADSKISDFNNSTSARTNDYLLLAQPDLATNSKISFLNFANSLAGSSGLNIVTNNYVPALTLSNALLFGGATYEIGVYDGTLGVSGGLTVSGDILVGNSFRFGSVSRGYFSFPSDGNVILTKAAGGVSYGNLILNYVSPTNGVAIPTATGYPTNTIAAAGTNGWTICVTNGNLISIKTNIAAAGSFTVKHLAP